MGKNVILGLNYTASHDSAAAIIVNDVLVAIGEEERFSRQKHDGSFPYQAIAFCLSEAGVCEEDVSYVTIGWDEKAHLFKRLSFACKTINPAEFYCRLRFIRALRRDARAGKALAAKLFPKAKIFSIEHHLAHAASCYLTSPCDESAVISWDGRGEWSTTLIGYGSGNKIQKIKEVFYPFSLGIVYTSFTLYLGFGFYDEYKVMGLSAYGEPLYKKEIEKILRYSEKKVVDIDMDYFQHPGFSRKVCWGSSEYYSKKFIEKFGPPRKEGEKIEKRHMDIACSLQICLNEIALKIAQDLYSIKRTENLCLAGGVTLNGVMDNYLLKNSGFKHIYFTPASEDAGVALGSALYCYNTLLGNKGRIKLQHPYWGSYASDDEIKKELEAYGFKNARELPDPAQTAAELLAQGNILGWYQGKSEFGQRALGNRSILADPRPAKNKNIVNAKIKFREEFRPFAPSVLLEHAQEYFDLPCESPYMLFICDVLEDKRGEIQAVTHINNTARPQTVSRQENPLFYELVSYFYKLTGCPIVLNTSFNVKGEPIVDSPSDAIRCFYTTGLDYLIIGKYLLHKKLALDESCMKNGLLYRTA